MNDIRRPNLRQQFHKRGPTYDSKRNSRVTHTPGRSCRDENNIDCSALVRLRPFAYFPGEVHGDRLNSSHERRPVIGVDQESQNETSIGFHPRAARGSTDRVTSFQLGSLQQQARVAGKPTAYYRTCTISTSFVVEDDVGFSMLSFACRHSPYFHRQASTKVRIEL